MGSVLPVHKKTGHLLRIASTTRHDQLLSLSTGTTLPEVFVIVHTHNVASLVLPPDRERSSLRDAWVVTEDVVEGQDRQVSPADFTIIRSRALAGLEAALRRHHGRSIRWSEPSLICGGPTR